jgi:hypothetical protein
MATKLFPRYQALLGSACTRSSASTIAKQSLAGRHYQAELGNEALYFQTSLKLNKY